MTSKSGANVHDLRRANRAVLLRELLFGGSTTRSEVAARTGLSLATVTTAIAEMLRSGLLVEAGTEDSDGGRPRTLLQIVPDYSFIAGIDVGESGVRVEVFDFAFQGCGSLMLPAGSEPRTPERVADQVAQGLERVLRHAGLDQDRLLGVGVGVSGIVETGGDGLVHAAAFGWHDVPFGAMLRARIARPVFVDNGAKTMGRAEMWFGAGRGTRDAAVALLGTGVGAGIFTDGQLYRGRHSSAGEWGHTPIVVDGAACRCGSRGCLEAYVGAGALLERWAELSGPISGPGDDESRLRDLVYAASIRPDAAIVLEDTARYLGAGLATLVNLFNPERIVLAGWVGLVVGPAVLDRVRGYARAYALRQPFEQTEIVLGQLGIDAVALGAATLVVDDFLTGSLANAQANGTGRVRPAVTLSA